MKLQPTKLRRFWESQRIELAEFEAPNVVTGQVEQKELPDGVTVEPGKGSWFVVNTPEGEIKANGKKALDELLDKLRLEAPASSDWTLESTYEIGDETIALGEIVALAFEDSEMSVDEWNDMDDGERKTAYREGVVNIPVPAEGFFSPVVLLKEGMEMTAEFKTSTTVTASPITRALAIRFVTASVEQSPSTMPKTRPPSVNST